MTIEAKIPMNFSISDSAKNEIANLRSIWEQRTSESALALCLSWATYLPHQGQSWEEVAVSFYGLSQRADIESLICDISGIKLVFFVTPRDLDKFNNRILDFSNGRGMFLKS